MDNHRRTLLKALAAAPVAAFAITEAEAQQAHHQAQKALQTAKSTGSTYKPAVFTQHEYATVRVLSDMIIPRDERSGGATDAGVPEFMDFTMVDQPARQTAIRGGLRWLDGESHRRFDKTFVAASEAERRQILDEISGHGAPQPGMTHGVAFFRNFRDLTASGFWTSKIGMADLGYIGNTFVADWQGCPADVLKKIERVRRMTSRSVLPIGRAWATFAASILVLFLEIALIRWMPAYIRLLSYFSNFILLASFLGIGIGCLLAPARSRLFRWFPLILAIVVGAVYVFRLEVAVPTAGSIYFSSGTDEPVVLVETTMLLPVLFVIVAVLFAALAQRMGREKAALPPLRGYTINLAGSIAGVALFGVMSWLELSPAWWFGIAAVSAVPLLLTPEPKNGDTQHFDRPSGEMLSVPVFRRVEPLVNIALLVATVVVVHMMARGALWSPYYKITVGQEGEDTVVEVNNIFHQSMAPVDHKEYFYQWPYAVFGDTFEDVLILGSGSGTDVAAALRHGATRVDAVEIDPMIIRLGREKHPDRPYSDPRVRVVNDDARHFLRTTDRKYDLVVFALIDSLTMQSSFSGVRLESYMFTEESFRAVRDRLKPDGVLVIYNYFRERWLVDRLANTAAVAFGAEPRVHVHEARAYLGVLMAGPRLAQLREDPKVPDRVTAYGQSHAPSPARNHRRDSSVEPASDDWPFLYLQNRHLPRHYGIALLIVLVVSVASVFDAQRAVGGGGLWSWQFFLLGAGFMLLETKSIIQFALLWGSTWVVASLAILSVLLMALAANYVVSRVEIRRPWLVGAILIALLAANYFIPIGRVGFESRAAESIFYAALVFSPILCAGLLFGSAIKRSVSLARDYGTNLLGAMVGGVGEYLSLLTGFRILLLLIALCYIGALVARMRESTDAPTY